MQKGVKNIPNILSISRIVLSVGMVLSGRNVIFFAVCFSLACITDVLDGFIARKLKIESELGSRLDSLGDYFFFLSLMVYMLMYRYNIVEQFVVSILVVVVIRLVTLSICWLKNKRIYVLHTLANKTTGIIVVAAILLSTFLETNCLYWIAIMIAFVSSVEELCIMIFIKNPDMNAKSMLSLLNSQNSSNRRSE